MRKSKVADMLLSSVIAHVHSANQLVGIYASIPTFFTNQVWSFCILGRIQQIVRHMFALGFIKQFSNRRFFSWSKWLFKSFDCLVCDERCGVSHELNSCLLNMTVCDMFLGAVPGTNESSFSSHFTSAIVLVRKSRVCVNLSVRRRATCALKMQFVCLQQEAPAFKLCPLTPLSFFVTHPWGRPTSSGYDDSFLTDLFSLSL